MRRKVTALIALTTTACTSWHVQPGPAPSAIEAKGDSHGAVRLTFKGGAFADIYSPQVVGDSIIGFSAPASVSTSRDRIAFATADVESVATKQVSPGRTILALAAIGLAVAIIVGSASSSSTTTSSNSSCAAARSVPSRAMLA